MRRVSSVAHHALLTLASGVLKEEYRTPFDSEEGPPAPFELEEAPGKRVFSLSGKFGDELVEVELDLEDQPGSAISEDDESAYEDEVEEVESVTFTCRITKNERVLSFECESDGDSVTIHHLELLTEPEDEDSTLPPYTGPVFPDLDDTLKQAFVDYLEERGITAELGEYLMLLTADKGWNEYMSWLTKVKGFIAER